VSFATYLVALHGRMEWLVPLLAIGYFLGEYLARYSGLDRLLAYGDDRIVRLEQKLNRAHRSAATRLYRGIIALVFILLPAALLGLLFAQPSPWMPYASFFVMVALLGRAARPGSLLGVWERARTRRLKLELPRSDYLFADTHGVLRHIIAASSESFAVGFVGSAFWFILGGIPAVWVYLALAATARHFRGSVFGWAATGLFRLIDAAPRALNALLFLLAAIFVPHAKPLATRRARNWQSFTAELIGASLGGPGPGGAKPWVGSGTAKLEAAHLARLMLLELVAAIFLIWLFSAQDISNLLMRIV
jgi:cobalamin biosynthesis protein CobD/CbiB